MNTCKNCNSLIKTNASTIQCDACQGLVHASCVGLSEGDVKVTRAKSRSIKVVCNLCNNNMSQFGDLKSLIDCIKNDFTSALESLRCEIGDRLAAFKQDVDNQLKAQKLSAPLNFDEVIDEVNERQTRKSNLILFGLPEPSEDLDGNARTAADNAQVSLVLKTLDSSADITNIKPRRLGRLAKTNTSPRPVKVALVNEAAVHSFLRVASKLRGVGGYEKVFLSTDKTPKQIQAYKAVRSELLLRQAKDEKNIKIKYIRGTPTIISLN